MNIEKKKILLAAASVVFMSFLLITKVSAQAGMSCGDNTACTEPGFVCELTTHQCVPALSEPIQTEDVSSQTGGNTGDSNSPSVIGCREGQDCVSLTNPLATTDIKTIIGNSIGVIMGIIGSITFLVFLYGGVLWLTSAGNSEKIQKGLQAMLWAGIGIIVIFSSYAIITLILNTLQATP